MDILIDLLLTLVKALIHQSIIFAFSRIPSKKKNKKTTRKKTRQSGGWFPKKK